ncbi:MAG TPA: TonB-dependent receptor [Chryseolinea sp.]|nr:TonB-dependent receptor [Chryseolinea sp.]
MKNKSKPIRNALLFFMKVTLINLLITSVSVMMAYAIDTNGQEVLDRKVTLHAENAEIKAVLSEIERKADVKFTYRPRLIQNRERVSLNVEDEVLSSVLNQLLGSGLRYDVIGKQIVLKSAEPAAMASMGTSAVNPLAITVSGTVKDEQGIAVPGVNVLVKSTTNGTTTDVDGHFSLEVPDESSILIFSFIGYTSQEVTVGGQTNLNITLAQDVQSLQEIVVVGYGEQKKTTITGAVTSVKSDVISQAPVTNLSNALVGRLPGAVFINRSGQPGSDGSEIRVRGTNTSGNPNALIVIDGIANRSGGLERLNPADIESITILKDGSAAIYGAQAANGVILVTTKRGQAGKPQINFNYNIGFNKPTRLPEVTDAPTYATMLNEIDEYRGNPARYSAADIEKYRSGSDVWTHPDTDWYGAVIKDNAMQDVATLSVSGGTNDGVKYYLSLGSLSENGVYKNSGTKYKQYNFRSNIDAKITDWLNISVDLAGRQEDRTYPTRDASTIFRMLIRGKPNLPAYWPNGLPGPDIENGDNPVVISTPATGYVDDVNNVFNSNLRARIDIPWVKGLNVMFNAAFDESFRPIKRFRTPWYLYTWDYTSYDDNGEPELLRSQRGLSAPELQQELERTSAQTTNAYINYSHTFGTDHTLALMAGTEKQVLKGNVFMGFRNGYISTAVDELFAGNQNASTNAWNGNLLDGKLYNRTRLNYFGRINYAFREKYLVEMVWRYDASYIFPEDSRWGFFPGVSAGWVVSEENFMQSVSFIDRLKLRGSWGQLGNDRMSARNVYDDEFQFANNFGFGGNYIFDYTTLTTSITPTAFPIANPNITWEVANNSNIGLEGTLLQGKVSFEVDYFSNKRSQMLITRNASIPKTAGFTPPKENIGELKNHGIDFLLNFNNSVGTFNYGISVNGGYSKNEMIFYDEPATTFPWQTQTGRPNDTRLMYKAIGVFETQADVDAYPHWSGARPGDIRFEDVSGDGEIDADDKIRMENNTIPRFQGGLTLTAGWKGFDLNILFQAATGARSYIRTQSGDFGNYLQDFADGRWTTENPSSEKPRTFNREDEYWISQDNSYWFRNTDYVRLKNIQLGYTLPSAIISKIGMRTARVYVNSINLITWDSFKVFDPETDNQDGTVYPQKMTFNAGVNIGF